MTKEEIKTKIEKLEKTVASSLTPEALRPGLLQSIDKLRDELAKMEAQAEKEVKEAEKKVEQAEEKVAQAETPVEKKEAQADLKEAKEEKKEASEVKKEIAQVKKEAKVVAERIRSVRGGRRIGAGRPKMQREPLAKTARVRQKAKASSETKMVKPVKKQKAVTVKSPKVKTVRAFGQIVEYKNDAEFCRQLIKAFKKRKAESKKAGRRRKTKPVFGVITSSVKNAVSKALYSVPNSQIQSNPKVFLAKAQRLEKSAIKFLEDFKAILGSDFKKSEITAEFGELERTIKNFVAKVSKK